MFNIVYFTTSSLSSLGCDFLTLGTCAWPRPGRVPWNVGYVTAAPYMERMAILTASLMTFSNFKRLLQNHSGLIKQLAVDLGFSSNA